MDDDSQTSPAPATAKKSHLLRHILTGFFAIAPLYVTWWVFQFMFGLLANAGKPLVSAAASLIEPISATASQWLLATEFQNLMAVLLTLLTLYIIGLLATQVIGRQLIKWMEDLMIRLPGVQIIWKGPTKEDDRGQQISVVENFINAGVTGIVLAPLDDVALAKPVQEAGRAGISVVVMDSALEADPCREFASFVATDNYVGGQHGARRLGEILGGKGKILLLRYQVGSASTVQREQGFLDTLKADFPDVQVVSADQYGGATTESAYAKAENLLNRFADLDGIFCPNESTTFGMLRALQGSGRAGKVKFVGFDSSDKLIQAMADGELHGLVLQDPLNMGYVAVKTLVAFLRGEKVATRIDTGSAVATPENMNDPRIRELLSPPIDEYLLR